MNKHVLIGKYGVLGIALLLGGIAATVQAQGTPEAEFKKITDAFSQAWVKGDAKAVAALHSKDAVRLAGNGAPPVVGMEAIAKGFGEALAGPYKGTGLTITPGSYRRVTADVYVGEGTYEVTGGTPPAGTALRGQYMNTMVREGGRWAIAASAVIPIPPPK